MPFVPLSIVLRSAVTAGIPLSSILTLCKKCLNDIMPWERLLARDVYDPDTLAQIKAEHGDDWDPERAYTQAMREIKTHKLLDERSIDISRNNFPHSNYYLHNYYNKNNLIKYAETHTYCPIKLNQILAVSGQLRFDSEMQSLELGQRIPLTLKPGVLVVVDNDITLHSILREEKAFQMQTVIEQIAQSNLRHSLLSICCSDTYERGTLYSLFWLAQSRFGKNIVFSLLQNTVNERAKEGALLITYFYFYDFYENFFNLFNNCVPIIPEEIATALQIILSSNEFCRKKRSLFAQSKSARVNIQQIRFFDAFILGCLIKGNETIFLTIFPAIEYLTNFAQLLITIEFPHIEELMEDIANYILSTNDIFIKLILNNTDLEQFKACFPVHAEYIDTKYRNIHSSLSEQTRLLPRANLRFFSLFSSADFEYVKLFKKTFDYFRAGWTNYSSEEQDEIDEIIPKMLEDFCCFDLRWTTDKSPLTRACKTKANRHISTFLNHLYNVRILHLFNNHPEEMAYIIANIDDLQLDEEKRSYIMEQLEAPAAEVSDQSWLEVRNNVSKNICIKLIEDREAAIKALPAEEEQDPRGHLSIDNQLEACKGFIIIVKGIYKPDNISGLDMIKSNHLLKTVQEGQLASVFDAINEKREPEYAKIIYRLRLADYINEMLSWPPAHNAQFLAAESRAREATPEKIELAISVYNHLTRLDKELTPARIIVPDDQLHDDGSLGLILQDMREDGLVEIEEVEEIEDQTLEI